MWEEDEEEKEGAEEEKALEDGLDEEEAEVIENKAAAKKHEEEVDPAALTVSVWVTVGPSTVRARAALPYTQGHCHLQMPVAVRVMVRRLPLVLSGAV